MTNQRQAAALQVLLDAHKHKRVVVIGTTCTGKSTLLRQVEGALDMDKLVFPLLSQAQTDYVCQSPWTPKIGNAMSRWTKYYVQVRPGQPVFGTVVLDADLIVYLTISDISLRARTAARDLPFDDAKNMQRYIEQAMQASGLPIIQFAVDA